MSRPAASTGSVGQQIVLPGQTPDGGHVLGVLLKRTYDVVPGARCTRAEADRKLAPADKPYGDPLCSSTQYESDFVPFKLATDVVLNGAAYAPGGRAVHELLATLTVGEHRRDLHVVGDRVARHQEGAPPVFTEPQPFSRMELLYERAYGGVDIYSDPKVPCVYARNPIGRGFAVTNERRAVDNLPLPNVEDPNDRLTPERMFPGHFMHWERQPVPGGFGWWGKTWQPRASLAGIMPADRATERELRRAYAQIVPPAQRALYAQTELPDMDFRFFNGASPGLVLPFLRGDETIHAVNLSAEGHVVFSLPAERPELALDIGAGPQAAEVVLHTVMIRLEERQVDMVWRMAVPYPGPDWLTQMPKMEVMVR